MYSMDESMQLTEPFAHIRAYLSDQPIASLSNFTIRPLSKDLDMYLIIDSAENTLRLVRTLDYNTIKSLEFAVQLTKDLSTNFTIEIKDVNNKPPKLELSHHEAHKYGHNLLITAVDDFEDILNNISVAVSSTPKMPVRDMPAIPEMGVPARQNLFFTYNTLELDENKDLLKLFNARTDFKAYKILDHDSENTFKVSFVANATSPHVLEDYQVDTNGTHLIFKKKNAKHLRSVDNMTNETFIEQAPMRSNFAVELSDGVNRQEYTGELVNIEPKQLQRLILYKPENGRYRSGVYRFTDETRIEVTPRLQVENQFPYDILVELAGTDADYLIVEPKVIRAGSNLGMVEIALLFKNAPVNIQEELNAKSNLDVEIKMRTSSNEYLNELLDIIANLKVRVALLNREAFEPKIYLIEPDTTVIELDEDVYNGKRIGQVKGVDRDRQDPGRMEYFLIGDSRLLNVDKFTGVITLNGKLDAEAQQSIEFICFARDMDHKPLGKLKIYFRLILFFKQTYIPRG
jgi:hypothetical protein